MPEKKMIVSSGSWVCTVLTLSAAGTEDDDSAKDISFPCYTDDLHARGSVHHSLSMDLPSS